MHAYLSECMHANDIVTFNYLLCAKLNILKHEKLHKIRVNMHDILQNCMQAAKTAWACNAQCLGFFYPCPKSPIRLGRSLQLQNQDWKPKFRTWVYQRPVTISKSRARCQTRQEPPVYSNATNQDSKLHGCFCTFKIKIKMESQNL